MSGTPSQQKLKQRKQHKTPLNPVILNPLPPAQGPVVAAPVMGQEIVLRNQYPIYQHPVPQSIKWVMVILVAFFAGDLIQMYMQYEQNKVGIETTEKAVGVVLQVIQEKQAVGAISGEVLRV